MRRRILSKTADGAEADGVKLDIDSLVSMNIWGLTPEFLMFLEKDLQRFSRKNAGESFKSRIFNSDFYGQLLEKDRWQ